MRKLNYFGQSLSRIRIGGFILASLGTGATASAAKTKEESPIRKKEITMSIKTEKLNDKDLPANPNFDKDKK